ncbi:MAG: hypothetical protein H6832_05400 [Planctomycetes bacterium]|nr:hypothetical protein [Planctomycetota bacterium]MCB9917818.1 hypothetical protein [Planctomycetota bacterium]
MMRFAPAVRRAAMPLVVMLIVLAMPATVSAQKVVIRDTSGADVHFPVVGTEVRVALEGAGDASRLIVLYRPNSKTSVEESIAIADGHATWIPSNPGLASLDIVDSTKASLAKRTVSIRFAETSYVGLAVMILAALLLFGGAAISIRALLRS